MVNFSSDFFEACLDLLEKEKGSALSETQNQMISKFLGDHPNLNEIKEDIISAIEDHSMPSDLRGEAFFTLGKIHDLQLRAFFIKHLKKEVKKAEDFDAGVLYQLMIALENLGEKVFNEQRSHSIQEANKNFSHAKAYINFKKN